MPPAISVADVTVEPGCVLFRGLSGAQPAWMSHGDEVASLPEGFVATGHTPRSELVADQLDTDEDPTSVAPEPEQAEGSTDAAVPPPAAPPASRSPRRSRAR